MTTTEMTSHDHLFKEILREFFPEFIDLFFPQVAIYLDRDSIEFQPLELFADLNSGNTFETDIVIKARFQNQESYFIIHVEHQAKFDRDFDRRMFQYFAMLHRDYNLPVYPIVIFSHRSPKVAGDRSYSVSFPDWEVLRFNYRTIRLNHLHWQDFLTQRNPVASAFMAKMRIKREDRVLVKLECLRSLTELNLNLAQLHLLSGFIDSYLDLDPGENQRLLDELAKLESPNKEGVMAIVTSWMREGIEVGEQRGIAIGEQRGITIGKQGFLIRLLQRKFGPLTSEMEAAIEQLSPDEMENLGEALLDFSSDIDLQNWFRQRCSESASIE